MFFSLLLRDSLLKARKTIFRATFIVSLVAGFALMLHDAGERYNLFKDTLAREKVIGKTNQTVTQNAGYLDESATGKTSAINFSRELITKETDSMGLMDVVTKTRFAIFMGTFFLVGFAQVWILYFLIMLGLTSKKPG